ncbi:carbamate kinase [[Collinsella] massiliensis]|uniref:Carbamate kinase n=1 Tax=[Collinsella] massiliensis TaxID=1232426 RepID=A0A1Y3XTX5_9ACTN|nr:carbamate kinase [[Collinsella] massiliensis]OUN88571.1 carbamate kinase [[Collinsella] massiliensis]
MSKPLGKPDRIVVVLGGNALGNTPEEQIERVNNAAHALLGLIEQGNEIIITHGNGPQVGMIQNAFAAAHDAIGTPAMDLPECGAMSQGYIGYHLQQGIGREMHKRYKRWHVATVVTQIEVDSDDPSFQNPTKPIGPFYTEEQAKEIMAAEPDKVFVDDSGRGWRRVVASPEPKKIVEAPSILNLLDNEFIVIACGGGGIPVVRDYDDKGCYKGVAAVIDKDAGGELLAEDCQADVLFLLTAVEHVAINFGKPDQQELTDITADEAERLADEGQFGKGSMEPKVRAAIKFARSRKGRVCIIGALDKASETMAGLSGTRIHC